MRSATLAQHRSCFSLNPVFSASALRPFTVRAASSRRSVDLIPAFFRMAAASPSIPSIAMMG